MLVEISPATSEDEAKAVKKHKHCKSLIIQVQLFILTDIGPLARLSSGCHTRTTHQLTESIKEGRSEQSESEADDDSDQTNFDGADSSSSDLEDPKSIAKTLSTEVCQLSHI
jgi:hypothetical protein